MKERFLPALVAALMFLSPMAFAADDPATTDKPATDKPAADKPAAPTSPAPATPAPGGGRFGGGGFGGAGGFGGPVRDPFAELLAALGDVNLSTDFTLTAEQKEKIQVIVTDFKKVTDQWRTDHAADLKKISDDMAALRNNNGGGGRGGNNQNGGGNNNRQQMQQIIQARQTLMDTQPKSDEPIAQIKGLLTTEQLKKLQAKLDERKAEADRNRQTFANGFGNRGGGNANGGNGGNNGGAANGAGGRGGRGGRGGGAGGGGAGGGGGGGRGGRGGGAGGAGAGNGL